MQTIEVKENGLKILIHVEAKNLFDDDPVMFPEDRPNTVVTELGAVKLEPIAFSAFRYYYWRYRNEDATKIPFADIAEMLYDDECKSRSTLQNVIVRGKGVNDIGVNYRYKGEYALVGLQVETITGIAVRNNQMEF